MACAIGPTYAGWSEGDVELNREDAEVTAGKPSNRDLSAVDAPPGVEGIEASIEWEKPDSFTTTFTVRAG